jgi:hypothetical protein
MTDGFREQESQVKFVLQKEHLQAAAVGASFSMQPCAMLVFWS